MALDVINTGSAPNDGTGDTVRDAFIKVNGNFLLVANKGEVQTITATWTFNSPLILSAGTAALPSIGWTDTGFYESAANVIKVSLGGFDKFVWTGNTYLGNLTGSAMLSNSAATATNPVHNFNGDGDTGLGSNAADQLSLIAGGVEGHRITEIAGLIAHILTGDVIINGTIAGKLRFTGIETSTATAKTLADADDGKYIRSNPASDATWTIPLEATVTLPIGFQLNFMNIHATSALIFAKETAGVTVNSKSAFLRIDIQNGAGFLIKIGTDEWDLIGATAA